MGAIFIRRIAAVALLVAAASGCAGHARVADVATLIGGGEASYYGDEFAGRPTASGERYDPEDFTGAHRTLPFGTLVRVTDMDSGRSVVVRINDRGPWGKGRVIDLSRAAAREIGLVRKGRGQVELSVVRGEEDE
jgi:rare lipoprotein A